MAKKQNDDKALIMFHYYYGTSFMLNPNGFVIVLFLGHSDSCLIHRMHVPNCLLSGGDSLLDYTLITRTGGIFR
jgi:hypothetical protein